MPALEFPRQLLSSLQDLGTRLLDSRKAGTENESFARLLLNGFYDICMRTGLDRVLVELEEAHPPLDISHSGGLSDHPTLLPAVVAQLAAADLDGGGPRNAKPGQLVNSLVTALGLTIVDEPDRTIALDDRVRLEAIAAIATVTDVEIALPQLRDSIIAKGRELSEPRYHRAYDQLSAHLDPRGERLLKQPKVPLDALHATQRVLFEARNAVVGKAARIAIDRAKLVIERANPEAAARIDAPITHQLTPRDVAILRACDSRVPKTPQAVAASLLESLTELSRFVWRGKERAVRPYAASQTFGVGDLVEHPKFGRGSVTSCLAQRIEVEFPDGKRTLIHVPPPK